MRLGVGEHLVPFFRELGGVGIDVVGHSVFRDDIGIIRCTMDDLSVIHIFSYATLIASHTPWLITVPPAIVPILPAPFLETIKVHVPPAGTA